MTAVERRIQEAARKRAATQARRVAWPFLLDAQERYLDWQEFYFWVRAIVESEGCIPPFLVPVIEQRCPGFLSRQQQPSSSGSEFPPNWSLSLWDWIDEQVFAQPRREGWFDAIEFFAVRHPQYQRAQACWLKCTQDWQETKPDPYPSSEEWRHLAATCEPETVLLPKARSAWQALRKVAPERLSTAIRSYLDWQAFAFWVRTAIETVSRGLPPHVEQALRHRCPGFTLHNEESGYTASSERQPSSWDRLLRWGHDHLFADAQKEEWLEAILFYVELHPRSMRIADYWLFWDRRWSPASAESYPSFEQWRQDADAYVEAGAS
jgi:hypothetical protein